MLLARHLEQLGCVDQFGLDAGEIVDNRFKRFLFFAQILGMLLVVPYVRIFQFRIYLFQLVGL
jgi:nitrate reductase NapE component